MVKKLLTYGTPKRLFVSGSPKRLTAGEAECECCPGGCYYCISPPAQVQIDLSGLADNGGSCSNYNGTWVLNYVDPGFPIGLCRWTYDFGVSPPCGDYRLLDFFLDGINGHLFIVPTLYPNNRWVAYFHGVTNGCGWNAESFPYHMGGSMPGCNVTGASAVITAL